MIEARAATCREEAVAAEGMALWLVPERHTGEDNLECGPLTLLPGEVLTVGKRDVDKKVYCLFTECYIMHVYMYICYILDTYNVYTGPDIVFNLYMHMCVCVFCTSDKSGRKAIEDALQNSNGIGGGSFNYPNRTNAHPLHTQGRNRHRFRLYILSRHRFRLIRPQL